MNKTVTSWKDFVKAMSKTCGVRFYPQNLIIYSRRKHLMPVMVMGTKHIIKVELSKDTTIATFVDNTTEIMRKSGLSFYSEHCCILHLVSVDGTDYALLDGIDTWRPTAEIVNKLNHIELTTEGNTRLDRIEAQLSLVEY